MKIAVISDIHGNMQALEAVLKDIENEKCDKLFCLGDLAMSGPQPVEAIKFLRKMIEEGKLISIQGNTDQMICCCNPTQIQQLKEFNPVMGYALENDQEIIPNQLKEFLSNLEQTKEIEILGVKILLAHGSPRKNNENISPDLPLDKVEEMIAETDADLIFVGHTHIPCGYQTNTKQTVVNVGSVGRPFTPNAQSCYAIVDIFEDKTFEVRHKFVKYDNQKAAEILRKRTYKGADKLAEMIIHPTERYPK